MTKDGQIKDFNYIHLRERRFGTPIVKKGLNLLQKIDFAAITPVFYNARYSKKRNLDLKSLLQDINWGEAFENIRYEGFYMFGGRYSNGEASNRLTIFQVNIDASNRRPVFSIIRPRITGLPPPPRYSHTLDYMRSIRKVAIYGGRNDHNTVQSVYDDLWLLKVDNLEYQKVLVAGDYPPEPRFNHKTFINDTQLIIFGGQNAHF